MIRTPGLRKCVLLVHLTASVGWIGAVLAYLALGLTAVTSRDPPTVQAAWIAMAITGWAVLVPLALAALLSGVVLALSTPWGLFRHYWVLISLGLTILATGVLLLYMPTVSTLAALARQMGTAPHSGRGGDLVHAGGGLLVLLVIMVLNIYKPRGLTPYGWRKQRAQRRGVSPRDSAA